MSSDPKFHVLLIGIDAYTVRPLSGCVNDIDAVQRLLLGPAGVPPASVTRLASPHPGTTHETTLPEKPATLENIRAALARLGSDAVGPTDRVFVYYSGHGGRVPVAAPQGTVHCESLIPVDFNADPAVSRLLPDYEFNSLLAGVARRTRSVTVVLDCCHSAGATRDVAGGPGVETRSLVFPRDFGTTAPLKLGQAAAPPAAGAPAATGVDDCQVAAACLNHELAQERVGDDGVRHGLLTRAFVAQLGAVPAKDLLTLPWARVWQSLRAAVEDANPAQHLWLSGNPARVVLAGPPVDGDAGFAVRRDGDDYRIAAGTLADVGVGAQLAVYGDRPALFPPLGSDEDKEARGGRPLLNVVKADRSEAVARSEAAPFDLPPGARVRLVAAGEADRLRCAVLPPDAGVVAALKESALLQVVEKRDARARLEKQDNGSWNLTDDVAGAKKEFPPLANVRPDQLGHARKLLELYARYSLPLRMAIRCTDLPGQLKVKLLACPAGGVPNDTAQKIDLHELLRHPALTYSTEVGKGFCVHVRNASDFTLRVVVVNCAATGLVEFLGDQEIDPRAAYRFWLGNTQGTPFAPQPDAGKPYIERIVAIGTTRLDRDLRYLENNEHTFAALLDTTRGERTFLPPVTAGAPVEKWSATEVLLGVGIPGAI